jgi:hypothetical protein
MPSGIPTAFADLLRKYDRPVDLKAAPRQSVGEIGSDRCRPALAQLDPSYLAGLRALSVRLDSSSIS